MRLITKYMIGMKCKKRSKPKSSEPKPFKSGSKFNTIKGLAINPHTGNYAMTFEEDESIVDFNDIVLLDDKLKEVQKLDIARQIGVHKNREKQNEKQDI